MQLLFNTTNCQGLVVRRQAYLDCGQHDRRLGMFLDDWEATISMLARGVRGVMIPHALFRYRIRGGSIFRSKANMWARNYAYIVTKHETFYSQYAKEIILFLNANGPNMGYHNPTFASAMAVSGGEAGSAALSGLEKYAHGRLFRLTRAYYVYTNNSKMGRKFRRWLGWMSPLLDVVFAMLYRFHRRMARS